MDPKNQARELRRTLDAKHDELAVAQARVEEIKTEAEKGAINLADLADAKAAELVDELSAATKGVDELRDAIVQGEARWKTLVSAFDGSIPERPAGKADYSIRNAGRALVESDDYQALVKSGRIDSRAAIGAFDVKVGSAAELKALLTGEGGGANVVYDAERLAGYVPAPREAITIFDYITVLTTSEKTIEWINQDTFAGAAAETAEGAEKPDANYGVELLSSTVRTIAHWIKATRQSLADAPYLEGLVNADLRYGVERRAQLQVLRGNGQNDNLRGIYNTSGVLSQPQSTDSLADAIHKAITKVRINYFAEPTLVGMHPLDFESLRLARDDSGAAPGTGAYLWGAPSEAGRPTVWGLPVYVSTDFVQGSPLVGDFSQSLFAVREGMSVRVSDSDGTDFVKNIVTVLAEMRAAHLVRQPKAFCEVPSGS
jgi:HK97 family phage major capsid protein